MTVHLTDESRHNIIDLLLKSRRVRVVTQNDLTIELTKYTHVPHQYTFKLINIALGIIHQHPSIRSVADPGTGSGIIGISIAKALPHLTVLASDISQKALAVAKKNAAINKVKNIQFFRNQTPELWLSEFNGNRVDFIVTNPPFIGTDEFNLPEFKEMWPESGDEPPVAIKTNDPDGLSPYISIFHETRFLGTKYILFECNTLKMRELIALFKPLSHRLTVYKDHDGYNRFLLIKPKPHRVKINSRLA